MTIIDVCPYCDTPLEVESNTYIVIECPHCHKYFDIDILAYKDNDFKIEREINDS